MLFDAVQVSTADTAAAASGHAAVVTYAAIAAPAPNNRHAISGIAWSYDADPTSGGLTIKDGTDTVFQIDITKGGPGFFPFPAKKLGSPNLAMVVTLADGSVNGKVNVLGHYIL